MRELFPQSFAVAQGFIDAGGKKKSKQCDILIYDSSLYAPLLAVNDLVILPIDAVEAVIEVKTNLDERNLKSALGNVALVGELSYEFLRHYKARQYIFAFDSPRLKTVAKYESLTRYQKKINGIYVLNKGFLRSSSTSEELEVISCEDTL